MNVSYPPEAESFRAEVRAFLRRALPDDWRGLGALDGDEARAFTETWRAMLAAEWQAKHPGVGDRDDHGEVLVPAGQQRGPLGDQ